MRYRERDNRLVSSSTMGWNRVQLAPGTANQSGQVAYQNGPFTLGSFESMTDVVTPSFTKRSARGEVIVNPMVKTKWTRTATEGGFSFKNGGTGASSYIDTYDGYYAIDRKGGVTPHAPVPIDLGALKLQAGTSAASNVDSSAFEGIVFLGELPELIRMLRNPVKGYRDWLSYMKREKNRSPKSPWRYAKLRRFIDDNWLGYRYGVRPLIYDAQRLMIAIDQAMKKENPQRRTARGSSSDSGNGSISSTATTYAANVSYTINTRRNVSVRAGILYEMYNSTADNFGLSFDKIPSAAWELIPFSFVVDWFANVGSYVGAITPKVGVRTLGSWTTTKDVISTTCTSSVSSLDDATDTILNPGHCDETYITETKTRAPGAGVGLTLTPAAGNLAKLDILQVRDLLIFARKLLASV